MAQDFDKIIKENLEAIFIPLTKKILAIETDIFEEIPDSVQETLEREPDFLKRVRHEDVSKDFILQIEFQTEHGAIIPARMLEYYGLLYKKYNLPVIQHIFYLRKSKWSVKNYVRHKNLDFSFGTTYFQDYSYRDFIDSDKQEEILLAILADFENQNPEEIISRMLTNVKNDKNGTFNKEKFVRQLNVLSKIRDLKSIVDKLTDKIMKIKYTEEDDYFYTKGIKKGREEGMEESKNSMIIALIKKGKLTLVEIAEIANVSLVYVQNLADQLKK